MHHRNRFCLNALKLTFPVVYNFTGKQHRIRHNNDIYITSEMALVANSILKHTPLSSFKSGQALTQGGGGVGGVARGVNAPH